MSILEKNVLARVPTDDSVTNTEVASIESVEKIAVPPQENVHIPSESDIRKTVPQPIVGDAAPQFGVDAGGVCALRVLSGAAAVLGLGSLILAALEVHNTVIYSHSYAGGTYDEELVQRLLIATVVEACIFLAATTVCFGVLMGRPSTAVLCRSQRTAFLFVCASAVVLFAFAVYTVVLQVLCAMWEGAYPMYIIQCIFSVVRALLVCGLLTLFNLN